MSFEHPAIGPLLTALRELCDEKNGETVSNFLTRCERLRGSKAREMHDILVPLACAALVQGVDPISIDRLTWVIELLKRQETANVHDKR